MKRCSAGWRAGSGTDHGVTQGSFAVEQDLGFIREVVEESALRNPARAAISAAVV